MADVKTVTLEEWQRRLSGVGHDKLIEKVCAFDAALRRLTSFLEDGTQRTIERLESTIAAQKKELERLRKMEAGLCLAGWFCAVCQVFNGEEKEPRVRCRSCDAPKMERLSLVEDRTPTQLAADGDGPPLAEVLPNPSQWQEIRALLGMQDDEGPAEVVKEAGRLLCASLGMQ